MAIPEKGGIYFGQENRQTQLPTRMKGEEILKPNPYVSDFEPIGGNAADNSDPYAFIDVEYAIRRGDTGAWDEATRHSEGDLEFQEALGQLRKLDQSFMTKDEPKE